MTAYEHNILALDLGTHTGWAIRHRDGVIRYGTVDFINRKRDHCGHRWAVFRGWLSDTLDSSQIHVIVHEQVRRHEGTAAAHVYGAFEALTQMAAATRNIRLLPVAVGTIKKAWTGRGDADKAAMIQEARRRGFNPDTDNAADALAILSWAAMRE